MTAKFAIDYREKTKRLQFLPRQREKNSIHVSKFSLPSQLQLKLFLIASPLLHVPDSPVCITDKIVIVGAYRSENLNVVCEVHADPPPRSFKWKFNSSGESYEIPKERHYKNGSQISVLQYTPVMDPVSFLATLVNSFQIFITANTFYHRRTTEHWHVPVKMKSANRPRRVFSKSSWQVSQTVKEDQRLSASFSLRCLPPISLMSEDIRKQQQTSQTRNFFALPPAVPLISRIARHSKECFEPLKVDRSINPSPPVGVFNFLTRSVFAGLPAPVRNCTISNQTQHSLDILCLAGYDGGLPQIFLLELIASRSGKLR